MLVDLCVVEELLDESPPGIGLCGWILTGLSLGLVLLTVPFSLFVCFKVRIGHLLGSDRPLPGAGPPHCTLLTLRLLQGTYRSPAGF